MVSPDIPGRAAAYKRVKAALCRSAARKLLPRLRVVARAHGYALGLHGSVARDIDLIAVPWTAEARAAVELVNAIRAEMESIMGWADFSPADANPTVKPHGRLAWSIHMLDGPYVDISVLPRRA